MKKILAYLLVLPLLFAVVACSDDGKEEEPRLELDEASIEFTSAGSNRYIAVTSNGIWAVSGGTEWCSADKETGTGNGSVIITASANPGAERETSFIFAYGTVRKTLKVYQEGKGEGPEPPEESLNSYFTDNNFLEFCLEKFDSDGDGELTAVELSAVKALDISFQRIEKLDGLEFFTGLTRLNCDHNRLSELSVSANNKLVSLDCSGNSLTSLDVSANPFLEYLSCAENSISELELRSNTALRVLNCSGNSLETLDIAGLSALEDLECSSNNIEVIDLSGCPGLISLSVTGNPVSSLDLSKVLSLTSLECSGTNVAELELGPLNSLVGLFCSGCDITSIDISGKEFINTVVCDDNPQLTSLDTEGCIAMMSLSFARTAVREIDIASSVYLDVLIADASPLELVHVWDGFDPDRDIFIMSVPNGVEFRVKP